MSDLPTILKAAIGKGASDIHLIVGHPPMARIHGEMLPLEEFPKLDPERAHQMAYSVLREEQRARFERDLELDCSFSLDGVSRFRLNCYQHRNGVAAVMRVIPSSIPTPQQIGLTPAMIGMTEKPRGLVLVTGPTGSGKSTTLAAMVDGINAKHRKNILTIEDPIEFIHQNKLSVIQQRELGQQTRSFAAALRSALRQDPDVILIGEMRDLETISLALTASETGHLVLGTLHTKDAPSSVNRIIDVFPPHQQQQIRIQVAAALQGVICQELLPRKDGKGRVAAREFMVCSDAARSLILEGKTHMIYSVLEAGQKYGMMTMDKYLAYLVQGGFVDLNLALAKSHDPQTLQRLIQMGAGTQA